jgi:2-polyprenyl-3-methyl-5-hydroxy-6-metoxy-1,4-benzoquinol methylase
MADYRYEGDELALFAHAHNWKQYWLGHLAPFIRGDVLEVGAGIGSNTKALRHLSLGRWLCLEPDEQLLSELNRRITRDLSSQIEVVCGTVNSLRSDQLFDTALYVDVLEHISDDIAELAAVAKHIRNRGHIIVLSPAHQVLYSPFDRAIGHQRRYNRASLRRCTPPTGQPVRMRYLDSAGYCLSLANRILLHKSRPTLKQILFWDRYILPLSRVIDPWLGFRFGKSILGVWQIDAVPRT